MGRHLARACDPVGEVGTVRPDVSRKARVRSPRLLLKVVREIHSAAIISSGLLCVNSLGLIAHVSR